VSEGVKNRIVAKLEIDMFRLTLLLCGGMYASLMILGEDKGQLRPGLALAASEGRLDDVWAEARAKAERLPTPVVEAAAAPVPAPAPVAETVSVLASAEVEAPGVPAEPVRDVVNVLEEPVFTLSSVGNEPVPGEDAEAVEAAVATAVETSAPTPEALPGGDGTIWYVAANSVNVRSGPSTGDEVLGKLGSGEAVLVVTAVDDQWARIVIQGDGMEGFVALRYLSAEAP
jgi:hypothetical protein